MCVSAVGGGGAGRDRGKEIDGRDKSKSSVEGKRQRGTDTDRGENKRGEMEGQRKIKKEGNMT